MISSNTSKPGLTNNEFLLCSIRYETLEKQNIVLSVMSSFKKNRKFVPNTSWLDRMTSLVLQQS